MKRELTEKEWELIEMIRNYHSAFPNGAMEFEWHIYGTLEELLSRS